MYVCVSRVVSEAGTHGAKSRDGGHTNSQRLSHWSSDATPKYVTNLLLILPRFF